MALLDYRVRLVAQFGDRLERVALFGSRARGEAREDSDIDVLVCIRGADWRDEREAAGIAGDAVLVTGVWLSPAVYASERFQRLLVQESPFARAVEREHIPL